MNISMNEDLWPESPKQNKSWTPFILSEAASKEITRRRNKYTGDPDVKPIIDAQFKVNDLTHVIRRQRNDLSAKKAEVEVLEKTIQTQAWVIFVLISLVVVTLIYV